MTEKFFNEVQAELFGKIGTKEIEVVMRTVSQIAKKYNITSACTDMIEWVPQFPECYKSYIITRKIEGMSDKTIQLYRLYLEQFFVAVKKPIKKITSNDIRVYLFNVQDQRKISNRSLDSRRAAISAFFAWSYRNEYIDKNPCDNVKPIKYEKKPREPLTEVELEMVRQSCKDERERAIVEVLYSTACRVSELVVLKISDIDFHTGAVNLFGKGAKYRESYLSDCALHYLKRYLKTRTDEEESVFVSERSPHKGLSKEGIESVIRNIGKRSGVDRLHPHIFRHSCATNLLNRGMDVTQIKDLLGHNDINTTMIYAKVDKGTLRENHRKFI